MRVAIAFLPLKWLLLGATALALVAEFGVDLAILSIATIVPTFVTPVLPWLRISISHLGCSRMVALAPLLGEQVVFPGAEFGHHDCESGHGFWLVMTEISGKPFVVDFVSECGEGLGVTAIDDLIFLLEETSPELTYELVQLFLDEGQIIDIRRFDVCTLEICHELGLHSSPTVDRAGAQSMQPMMGRTIQHEW